LWIRTGHAHVLTEAAGEQPHAGEQVENTLPRTRREHLAHRRHQGLGRARVHLPEAVRLHPPVASCGALGHPGAAAHPDDRDVLGEARPAARGRARIDHHRAVAAGAGHDLDLDRARPTSPRRTEGIDAGAGQRAHVDDLDLVRPVASEPEATVVGGREPHPGPPAEPVEVAVDR